MSENIEDQVECLQTQDPISILNCPVQVGHMGPIAVVDGSFSDEPFLPDHPRNLIKDGNYHKDAAVLLGSNRFGYKKVLLIQEVTKNVNTNFILLILSPCTELSS